MKRLLLSLLAFALIPLWCWGQRTLDLKTGTEFPGISSTIPTRDIQQVSDGIIVTYTFNSAILQDDPLFAGHTLWSIDGFGYNDVPELPATLFRNDTFTIPDGKTAKVEIIKCEYQDFRYALGPARQQLMNRSSETHSLANVKPVKSFSGFFPETIVEATNISTYRGIHLQNIEMYPIQYCYETKSVRAYTTITFKVTFYPSTKAMAPRLSDYNIPVIADDDSFLSNVSIPCIGQEDTSSEMSTRSISSDKSLGFGDNDIIIDRPIQRYIDISKDYLIITTNDLLPAAQRFAEWKKLMGYRPHILSREKGQWQKVDSVYKAINTFYKTHPNLYYLLIIGAHANVPSKYSSRHLEYDGWESYFSDYIYSCMTTDQSSPDIYIGRLPVSSLTDANTIIDKIIKYERAPVTTPLFYKRGLSSAWFEDMDVTEDYQHKIGAEDFRDIKTSEDIRNYLMQFDKDIYRGYFAAKSCNPRWYGVYPYSNGEEIPDELKRPNFAWDTDSTVISSKLNSGAFIMWHLAHGTRDSWYHPAFKINHVNALRNGSKLPVVFSMGCQTGELGKHSDTNITAALLKNPNGGAVAVISPSWLSIAGWNDALLCGMIDALWPTPGLVPKFHSRIEVDSITPHNTPTYELGRILLLGKKRMHETFASKGYPQKHAYTDEIFHCFGDPSMQLYTDRPTSIASDVTITRNQKNVQVKLNNLITAKITFYDTLSGKIAAYNRNSATFSSLDPTKVTVCVSSHNKIPYISYAEDAVFLQNTVIDEPLDVIGKNIFVGSDVNNNKPTGPVIFNSGGITLTGECITIKDDTTISTKAQVKAETKTVKHSFEQ